MVPKSKLRDHLHRRAGGQAVIIAAARTVDVTSVASTLGHVSDLHPGVLLKLQEAGECKGVC